MADLLRIYLNDHLGAVGGWLALARRTLGSNPDGELGRFLTRLVAEIDEDRAALERIHVALGLRRNRPKEAVVRAAVGAGRLKLNGRLRSYSPLSRVVELEGIALGIEGRNALWESLRATGIDLPADLDELVRRTERQRLELGPQRIDAARRAFGTGG